MPLTKCRTMFVSQMENTVHYIFITDDDGITKAYQGVKTKIVEKTRSHISLIFFSSAPMFSKELEILHNRFPERFLLYFDSQQNLIPGILPQEVLEPIINANTQDTVEFILSGEASFLNLVTDNLSFLGFKKQPAPVIYEGALYQISTI